MAELKKEFKIGDLLVDISNITIKEEGIIKDSIAKFIVKVESKWNEDIEDSYISINIDNNEKSVNSESFGLNPWEIKEIPIYLETADLIPGNYKGEAVIYYESKTTSREFEFVIRDSLFKDLFGKNILIILLISVLILFIVINSIQFFRKYRISKVNEVKWEPKEREAKSRKAEH